MKKIFYIVTFLLIANFGKSQVTTDEFNALKALYNSTDGGDWTNQWDTTSNNADTWYGITVLGVNVTEIDLHNNNLVGTIPVEIGNFPNLTDLYLYNNQITGNIPLEIGNLANLQYLYLHTNQLNGNIPNEITVLSMLNAISLSRNQLNGNIPNDIGNLTNLTFFKVGENSLDGEIPSSLTNLLNLRSLSLANNSFSGTIPTSITNLGNLEYLHLDDNNFTGTIPNFIGNLVNLIQLRFNNNQLSGSLPEGLGNLNQLTELDISNNQYTFAELEPVMDTLPALTDYAPQDSLPVTQDTYNLTEGDALNLTLTTGGDNNIYRWYKGLTAVSSESSSPDFSIAEVALSDAGTYVCRVTNSIVPNLWLYSDPITVTVAEDPTGINDQTNNHKISIHPNPTNGPITIKAQNIQRISIQNMAGQMVLSQEANGEDEMILDVSKLGGGIYVVVVETGEGTFRSKLIMNYGL